MSLDLSTSAGVLRFCELRRILVEGERAAAAGEPAS